MITKLSLNAKKLVGLMFLGLMVVGALAGFYGNTDAQWNPNYIGWPGNTLNNFYPTTSVDVADILMMIIGIRNFILFLGIVLGIIFLVLGGINYMRSGGDEAKMATARAQIIGGIIGLAVAVAAFVLLSAIVDFVEKSGQGITELQ